MEPFNVEVNNRYEAHYLTEQEANTGLVLDDLWDNIMKKV